MRLCTYFNIDRNQTSVCSIFLNLEASSFPPRLQKFEGRGRMKRKRKIKSNSNMVSSNIHFPLEIIEIMLLKLPVKQLLQCRSVSKSWRTLIDDPCFTEAHFNESKNNNSNLRVMITPNEIFSWNKKNKVDSSKLYNNFSNEFEIWGSCRGYVYLIHEKTFQQFLWNPSIRRKKPLPSWRSENYAQPDFVVYGFGYNSSTKDYAAVRVAHFLNEEDPVNCHSEVGVLSVGKYLWRKIEDINYRLNDGRGILVNDALHWMAYTTPDMNLIVLAFDIQSEKFMEVPVQLPQGSGLNNICVAELDGKLCVVHRYLLYVELWVMKEYGVTDSWSMLYKTHSSWTMIIPNLVPLCYLNLGKDILLQDREKLYLYRIKKKNLLPIKYFPEMIPRVGAVTCVESLICIDSKVF